MHLGGGCKGLSLEIRPFGLFIKNKTSGRT
jgi:hypothetical protein